eukprot:988396-Rhodomonas_salina.1
MQSTARKRQRSAVSFLNVIRSEDAQTFFKVEELKGLQSKFADKDGDSVSVSMLGKLRAVLRKRRDKVSRALLSGRDVSESEPEPDDQQSSSVANPPANQPKQSHKTVAKSASSIAQHTERNLDGAKGSSQAEVAGGRAETGASSGGQADIQSDVRRAVEREANIHKRKRPKPEQLEQDTSSTKPTVLTSDSKTTHQTTLPSSFSSSNHVHLKSKELLNYNPSLAAPTEEESTARKKAFADSAERYVCWLGVDLDPGLPPSVCADNAAIHGHTAIICTNNVAISHHHLSFSLTTLPFVLAMISFTPTMLPLTLAMLLFPEAALTFLAASSLDSEQPAAVCGAQVPAPRRPKRRGGLTRCALPGADPGFANPFLPRLTKDLLTHHCYDG